jgi:Mce-associated membrane protein
MTDAEREVRTEVSEAQTGTDGPEAPPPAAGGEPAGGRRRLTLVTVAAVVFALLAVGLAFVAVSLERELSDERSGRTAQADDRRQVEQVAGRFSEALLTYDHEDLEGARQRVLELSTGRFRSEYESAFAGLVEMIETTEARARATVRDVFVAGPEGDTARAVTVVDSAVEGVAGPRRVLDTYIRLDLVKRDGEWLVDGVTSLNFTGAGPGEGPPVPEPPPGAEGDDGG